MGSNPTPGSKPMPDKRFIREAAEKIVKEIDGISGQRSLWYKLVDRKPVPCSIFESSAMFEDPGSNVVAQTELIPTISLSTVFLGLDHSHRLHGPPLLFETMVFVNGEGADCVRHSTWEEAEAYHNFVVEHYKNVLTGLEDEVPLPRMPE